MAIIIDRDGIEKIAIAYGNLVKDTISVASVYLYGSYSKGNNTIDSDIDIAIVGDDFSGDPIEDTLLLMKLRRKIDIRIEPRPFRSCDFSLDNPIVREIVKTGKRLI